MSNVSKASLDSRALAMMSKTYFFEQKNPIHPMFKTIGNARVAAVVINETTPPELLLQGEGDDPAYYHMEELSYSSALQLAM